MRHKLLVYVFLIVATFAVYWQLTGYEFVDLDDSLYITNNPQLKAGLTGQNVIWAFTTDRVGLWIPLTWLSFMLDFEFWGLDPGGYHLTNLLFHIANILLLFLVLNRITGALWKSAFVAALFAIHPLHVESVAWVTERKDVLSTMFWILTIWAYVRYVEQPTYMKYLLTLFTFVLSLMAKPVVVTLPCVLLLLDYWPLDRFQVDHSGVDGNASRQPDINLSTLRSRALPLILEKIPFLGLAAAVSAVTFVLTEKETLEFLPIKYRIANSLVSYVTYIVKMIWPHDLAVPYPHPYTSLSIWKAAGAGVILIIISFAVIRAARRLPYLAVGWLWYLVTLVPNIGLVQAGRQAMADRFTYIPLIGLFIMVAWGVPELVKGWRLRRLALGVSASVLLLGLMVCTRLQTRYWKDPIALFTHAVNVTADNYVAHYSLGLALGREGKLEESMKHSYEALRIKPDYAEAHNNLGTALAKQGRLKEAVAHFSEALRINPDYHKARENLDKAHLIMRKRGLTSDNILDQ